MNKETPTVKEKAIYQAVVDLFMEGGRSFRTDCFRDHSKGGNRQGNSLRLLFR